MWNPFKGFLIKRAADELNEMRPLPLGRAEFEEWSTRIIRAAQIPGATDESLKFALAEMVLHVKPTQSFEKDAHFVHSLRKGAANQVAHTIFQELKKAQLEKQQDGQKILEQ